MNTIVAFPSRRQTSTRNGILALAGNPAASEQAAYLELLSAILNRSLSDVIAEVSVIQNSQPGRTAA